MGFLVRILTEPLTTISPPVARGSSFPRAFAVALITIIKMSALLTLTTQMFLRSLILLAVFNLSARLILSGTLALRPFPPFLDAVLSCWS